ncbi:MAG: hypothetical protein ABIC68_01000 [Candidatus Omnitrophota bacterium]
MLQKSSLLLSVLLLLGVVFCMNACAESQQDRIKDFSINTLVSDSNIAEKAKREGKIDEYLACAATVRNDISLCKYVSDSGGCKARYLRFNDYYRELILTGSVSRKAMAAGLAIDICSSVPGLQKMGKAFVEKDSQICQSAGSADDKNYCLAIMTRNAGQCPKSSPFCRDEVYYSMAIEANNVKECSRIRDKNIRFMCIGAITLDEEKCKECQGFRAFVKDVSPPNVAEEPNVFKRETKEAEVLDEEEKDV